MNSYRPLPPTHHGSVLFAGAVFQCLCIKWVLRYAQRELYVCAHTMRLYCVFPSSFVGWHLLSSCYGCIVFVSYLSSILYRAHRKCLKGKTKFGSDCAKPPVDIFKQTNQISCGLCNQCNQLPVGARDNISYRSNPQWAAIRCGL